MNTVLAAIGRLTAKVISVWENEPVAVSGLVTVLLDAAVAFGAPISDDQKTAVIAIVSAIGVLIARSQVSPVA